MGWMTRFEPATSGSTDRRSNQLSYIHHKGVTPALFAEATLILYKFSFLLGKFFLLFRPNPRSARRVYLSIKPFSYFWIFWRTRFQNSSGFWASPAKAPS